jgi:hypothetical protein
VLVPKAPDLSQAQATVQAAGQRAGAYFSSWGSWAAEKRKTGWRNTGTPSTTSSGPTSSGPTSPIWPTQNPKHASIASIATPTRLSVDSEAKSDKAWQHVSRQGLTTQAQDDMDEEAIQIKDVTPPKELQVLVQVASDPVEVKGELMPLGIKALDKGEGKTTTVAKGKVVDEEDEFKEIPLDSAAPTPAPVVVVAAAAVAAAVAEKTG